MYDTGENNNYFYVIFMNKAFMCSQIIIIVIISGFGI